MMTLDDHPELEQTHALADGELTGEAFERAQEHLATCEHCQAELANVMQLEALPMPRPANVISLAWYRKRPAHVASVLVVAAAAATVLYLGGHRHAMAPTQEAPVKVALADTRALEARLSWQGASDYRAYSVPRGQALAKEPISLAAMADAEKRGDLHGVAALALLGGDLEQAKKYLALAGESADVLADHAALELSLGAPDKALALADHALEKSPDDAAATWNRALALRDLGLRHDAAEAFRAVAKRGESGWAMEATKRADELERSFKDELQLTKRVWAAATPLVQTQSGLSLDDARRLPATARIELYDALRAAPNAQAAAQLLPIAEAIDSAGGDHSTVDAVKAAKPDPRVAAAYRSILTDSKPDRAKLLATLRAAHANDALAVALIKLGDPNGNILPADLPELIKLSQASGDPWIRLLGIEQHGLALLASNDLPAAEAALLPGRDACRAGAPSYRCMKIEMALGRTYLGWQRFPESQTALLDAWKRAFALLAVQQDEILPYLVDVATVSDDNIGGGLPLVRAYTSELAARAVAQGRDAACDFARWGHERVAGVLQVQGHFEDAKRELDTPPCAVSYRDASAIVAGLLVRATVLHVIGTPGEITTLRAEIAKVRANQLPPGPLALLDHAEGRVAIGTEPAEGVALLREAIATGKKASFDGDGQRAIGMSYALLAIHASKSGDPAEALSTLGEEVGLQPRATCVLGLVADDRESIAITRGASGQTSAVVSARPRELDPDKLVGKDTLAALAGCKDIDVIARPPYNGMSRLLPDDFAWRYVSPRPRSGATSNVGNSLVVADVEPPASLGLPRLASWSRDTAATLVGPAATPARVLAAIGQSRDVTIHAHGFADQGDASYLALSPDPTGQYALTAREVSRAKFASAPLVILAACETAKAAPQFATRWSLPIAFLTAGARAVVAPTTAVPDQEAGPFFDQLRSRAAMGAPLAEVVRDLRKEWLAERKADWVRDVVVFE